ncbi:MAG TPA: hypothetical protein VFL66_12470 [Gaiellaceae bacterium]|nr:hypothetical protein [Gaiellaceae bacterium]
MTADAVAYRMSSHIDGLARALAGAGADEADASRLLELAALAAMHAVTLAEVAAEPPAPARRVAEPAPVAAPVHLPAAA